MIKLHPIVFFEAHADPLQYDLIISNLDKLIDDGYNTLCLELYKGTDRKQLMNDLKQVKNDFINSKSEDELALREGYAKLYDFLIIIKNKGLKVEFIDPIPHEQQTTKENVDKFQSIRNKEMSDSFIQTVEKNNGGVLALFGFAHSDIIEIVENQLKKKHLYDHYKPVYIVGRSTDSWVKMFYQHDKTTAIQWFSNDIEYYYNLTPKSFTAPVHFIETKVHPYNGDGGQLQNIIDSVNKLGACQGSDNLCYND